MFSATDWALKRVLKFVLKKSLGRFLHSEPDLEQLDVQLSSGIFELRNVLLNCQAVNEQLVGNPGCRAQGCTLHGCNCLLQGGVFACMSWLCTLSIGLSNKCHTLLNVHTSMQLVSAGQHLGISCPCCLPFTSL